MLSLLIRKLLDCQVYTFDGIQTATDGMEIIDPDLAFLDISLKDGKGYELLPTLRERFGDGMKIVMISAYTNEVEVEKALASGADKFLSKPFGKSEIIETLRAMAFKFN